MQEEIEVSIVIPSWNRHRFVTRTIRSVLRQHFKGSYEIVVIDNGSRKPLGPYLQAEFSNNERKHVKILRNSWNKGASYARNQGIVQSSGEYVLFMDSDCFLYSPGSLTRMVEILKGDTAVGAVGGELGGRIEYQPDYLYRFLVDARGFTIEESIDVNIVGTTQLIKCDYVTTACCMMRKKDLMLIGGFNERFFYLAEDKDLGLRLSKLPRTSVVSRETAACHLQKFPFSNEIPDYTRSRLYDNTFRLNKERFKYLFLNFSTLRVISVIIKDLDILRKGRPKKFINGFILELATLACLLPTVFSVFLRFGVLRNSHWTARL